MQEDATSPDPLDPRLAALREEMSEGMVRIGNLYGLPPLFSRLYTILFFAKEPMSLGEVTEALGVAKSTASTTLRRLEKTHLIQRIDRSGDRQSYYAIVVDPVAIVSEWLRRILLPELDLSERMIASLEEGLEALEDEGVEGVEAVGRRVRVLSVLVRRTRGALGALLDDRGRPDRSILAALFGVSGPDKDR